MVVPFYHIFKDLILNSEGILLQEEMKLVWGARAKFQCILVMNKEALLSASLQVAIHV